MSIAEAQQPLIETLVIGYGNTLRSDDGAGYRVAEIVASWHLRSVKALAVHQLTPDLAEIVAHSQRVVFVDASLNPKPDQIKLEPLLAGSQPAFSSHYADPAALLHLANVLYGARPSTAYRLWIPAETFDLGDRVSDSTMAAIQQSLEILKGWIQLGD